MQFRLVALMAVTALITPTLAGEDAAILLGREIVTRDCSGCHAVGPTGESTLAIAPHFRDLGQRYDLDSLGEALVEGIATAHAEMPQFTFEPGDAEAIIAYLKSIQPNRPEIRTEAPANRLDLESRPTERTPNPLR